MGYFVTFLCGWLVSAVLNASGHGGEVKIYLDNKQEYINTDLFSPPVARRLKLQNAKRLESDENVSDKIWIMFQMFYL